MKNLVILMAALVIPPGVIEKLAEGGKPISCEMYDTEVSGYDNCQALKCSNGAKKWESPDAVCDAPVISTPVIEEDVITPDNGDVDGDGQVTEFDRNYSKVFL